MGLRKKVFYATPDMKISKEDQERYDRAWEILCEKGSVCVTDPSEPVESIIDIIKKDPHALTCAHCDFNSADGMSYAEFVERVLAGEYDEK